MSILVTGGVGYIGSHVVIELEKNGYDVVIVDNFSNSRESTLDRINKACKRNIPFYHVDMRDKKAISKVFSNHRINAVIHLAALKSVFDSTINPIGYYENNVSGLIALLEVMSANNCKKIIFSSSCTVYSKNNNSPISEDAMIGYESPYGHTKIICEEILESISSRDSNWKVGVLRYFNPAGCESSYLIGEFPRAEPKNLMPLIAKTISNNLGPIKIYGGDYPTKDGTPIRDYIHIEDLAEAHIKSLKALDIYGRHAVNIGTGCGYTVLEVIKMFEIIASKKISYEIAPRRQGDVAIAFANPQLAKKILNWQPKKSLSDMCRSSWNWQMELSKYE